MYLKKIDAYLSGNIIKNVKSVKIPNSNGMVGIEASIAMGAILGQCERELMVISHVDTTRLPEVQKYINENRINVFLNDSDVNFILD